MGGPLVALLLCGAAGIAAADEAANWKWHHIDDLPWRAMFILAADIDGDGHKDLVSGGWWWENPGDLGGEYIAENPRPINSTKLYNTQGEEESVARMFRLIFAGGASARFHRPHPLETPDAQETSTRWGLGLSPRARITIRSARMLTDAMDLFVCEPRNDLLADRQRDEAFCLADPGKQYAVYFPDGGSVTLDLSDAPESLTARWIDIQKAEWTEEEPLRGGGRVQLSPPGQGHWAVLITPVRSRSSTRGGVGL